MPKTKEELTQLKKEYEALNNKLKDLTEEELKLVVGGRDLDIKPDESPIGNDSNKNTPPPDINPRQQL